jgi:hypothetical protein
MIKKSHGHLISKAAYPRPLVILIRLYGHGYCTFKKSREHSKHVNKLSIGEVRLEKVLFRTRPACLYSGSRKIFIFYQQTVFHLLAVVDRYLGRLGGGIVNKYHTVLILLVENEPGARSFSPPLFVHLQK